MKTLGRLSILWILALLLLPACRLGAPARATDTPTPGVTSLPPLPTKEPTLDIATVTQPPPPPPTDTPTVVPPPPLPEEFTISLSFEADTVCGGAPFEFDYLVRVEGETMSLLQLNAGITTTGPISMADGTYTYTTTLSGLPGTETYTGTISTSMGDAGGVLVTMDGEYGYGADSNFCNGLTSSQIFAGEQIVEMEGY